MTGAEDFSFVSFSHVFSFVSSCISIFFNLVLLFLVTSVKRQNSARESLC